MKTRYVCRSCGYDSAKWLGRCPNCGEWNTLVEEASIPSHTPSPRSSAAPVPLPAVVPLAEERLSTGISELDRVLGGGIVPGSLILVGGDPGIGKCVTGETRILDPETGDYRPVTAWQNARRPVLSLEEGSLHLRPAAVSTFHDQGLKPVVRLVTRLGRVLRCTPSHPVLTPDGWRAVGGLQPTDRIASPRSLPYFGHEQMSDAEIKLLAHILSEGSTRRGITVTTSLRDIARDLEEIAAAFGLNLRRYTKRGTRAVSYRFVKLVEDKRKSRNEMAQAIREAKTRKGISWATWARLAHVSYGMLLLWRRGQSTPSEGQLHALAGAIGVPLSELAPAARDRADRITSIVRFLDRHELRGKRASEKRVPACIFRLPRRQLALFLRSLFSGDGSVYYRNHNGPRLSYSTISRELAEDVQHLLLRFGIVARLRTKSARVNGDPYTAYEVVASGALQVQEFVTQIGILGRDHALAALEMWTPTLESTLSDTVPTGEAFWASLHEITGGMSLRSMSRQAGLVLHYRPARPLRRTTLARLADAFPHPRLRSLGYGDVYWDEVVTVEADGEKNVYDITVPGFANFVANGLIVHNSTLMLQAAERLAASGRSVLYVSGEESPQQTKLRAQRVGAVSANIWLLAETNLDAALEQARRVSPSTVVIDSIQTMYRSDIPASPGSIAQVRECATALLTMAKGEGIAVLLVGHVTKEGAIAGPRVLEHVVDTVLYFEGERHQAYRILRAIKNRFGSTNEIGVFEMHGAGLREVPNPSAAFLSGRPKGASGAAVVCAMEGTRPLLVEVQALVKSTPFGNPRRAVSGFDYNRLLLLLAVLEKRAGLPLASADVYINAVGGMTLDEPAADLGVAMAIASSHRDRPIDSQTVFIGEVGLSGEIRAVPHLGRRLTEVAKLGFRRVMVPGSSTIESAGGLQILGADTVRESLDRAPWD